MKSFFLCRSLINAPEIFQGRHMSANQLFLAFLYALRDYQKERKGKGVKETVRLCDRYTGIVLTKKEDGNEW
jgi:hypothetical protein